MIKKISMSGKTSEQILSGMKLFIVFMGACIFLDLFEIWARVSNVALLKEISCSVHPFLFSFYPMISAQLVNYATNGCQSDIGVEPLFSLIFFMIKLNMAVIISIPYWLYFLFSPYTDLLEIRDRKFLEFAKPGSILKLVKTVVGTTTGLLLLCVCFALYLTLDKTPNQYLAIIRIANFYETIVAGIIFFCVMGITANAYVIVSYFLNRKRVRHGSNVPLKSEGELFKKVLGEKWLNLHADIRHRFDKNSTPGNPLRYEGTLDELGCSFWGKILACLTWPLIKGALLPFCATAVPVNIQVYSKKGCPFIFKERIYKIPGRTPVMFTSYMKESEKGEVLEYVGAGLGMRLRVFEKDANLHFESDGYFLDIGVCRIPLLELFSPGHTYLMHINENENSFRIKIDIKHRLFGKMFAQAGSFNEVKA